MMSHSKLRQKSVPNTLNHVTQKMQRLEIDHRQMRQHGGDEIPKHIVYASQLQRSKLFYQINRNAFAICQCNERGQLLKKYCVVERVWTSSSNPQLVCFCNLEKDEAANRPPPTISPCCHVIAAEKFWPLDPDQSTEDEKADTLVKLSETLYGFKCSSGYGVVSQTTASVRCVVCASKVTSCSHVKRYKSLLCVTPKQGIPSPSYDSVSHVAIPYPLPAEDQALFRGQVLGKSCTSEHLVPIYDPQLMCSHGHAFDSRDPVSQGWVENPRAKVHHAHASEVTAVYHRPSTGPCACKMFYDGRKDLLFNLDNKNLYQYWWLFDILHNTQETRYPLRAAFRAANRTRNICTDDKLLEYHYTNMRLAYNSFIRMLDLDFNKLFCCTKCGPDVQIVVMDGIMMGCREELVRQYDDNHDASGIVIPECARSDRVLICSPAARKLLSSYTALNKGKYGTCKELSTKDFKSLCDSLKENRSIQLLVKEAGKICPPSHQRLLGELAKGSPTCAVFQIATDGQRHVLELLKNVRDDEAGQDRDFEQLRRYCPLMLEIIQATDIKKQTLMAVLEDIIRSIQAPFSIPAPTSDAYSTPTTAQKHLEFFPNHPVVRGPANYKADEKNDLNTGCRKDSQSHATLSPGLFTMFCQHGVCIGFQLMNAVESPRTAFDIITQRFPNVPQLVIYDNACKFHLFALKREPQRFRNTRFMVDRMHFKGHVGCTLGYCMDMYQDPVIAAINSQANEQANADLRRLSTQITYMAPANVIKHTSVFLALRNRDKLNKLA